MSKRQRMTWAALNREAAAAPAIPGYGVEDQDHPAHTQDDPGKDDYKNGDTSSWAEDVYPGPYGDSGPPAIPGYGVEDQDHPAHQGQVGRQASVMDLVRRKSAKALVLAKATLGKKASWDAIEDQAFGYMSMDDGALDASIERLGGDFLGFEDELDDDDGMDMLGMDDLDDDFDDDDGMDMLGMDDLDDDFDDNPMMARLMAMETEIHALRSAAGQNDPDGKTLGTNGKSEDEEKKEEDAANKEAAMPFMAMFDTYDSDGDGFVTAEDWGGPRAMFASIDTDGDGIIARHEVMAGCEKLPEGKMRDNCEKKKEEDGGDEKAEKKAFGEFADDLDDLDDFDDDEMDMLQAMDMDMDMDMDDDDAMLGCGSDVMASKKSDEDTDADEDKDKDEDKDDDDDEEEKDDKGSDKEASGDTQFFATGFDPMGLGDGTEMSDMDDAALRSVFGSDDEDEDEDKGSDKEASLAAILNPQPRKASTGVKSIGKVAKQASSGGSEINELSSLWASDPDVSGSFS